MIMDGIRMVDPQRIRELKQGFFNIFGRQPEHFFSAPGRTEICGNHTDHQQGCVLAAAVDLDSLAAVSKNDTGLICLQSQGYGLCKVALDDLSPRRQEENTTVALVRGVAAQFQKRGAVLEGVDIYVTSRVLPGSGLSSSAAFEVLLGTIMNHLFFDSRADAVEIARIAQYAENVYFGKPCGLMDQMASSVGNLVAIDFYDGENPVVTPIDFDFSSSGHALCIIDSGASHADLTREYAAIPRELRAISGHFGRNVLSRVDEREFYDEIPRLREIFGDRAVLRGVHFYEEQKRVTMARQALEQGDFQTFLSVLRRSGRSSFMYLQNICPAGAVKEQAMAMTLALCEKYLEGTGACRVHGGGFAGTCQAFVPLDRLEAFRRGIDGVLGEGACHVLSIRPLGGMKLELGK